MFIQHFSEWPRVLAEKARVTRPGGLVIFDFGNQEHVDASGLRAGDGSGFPYFDDPANPANFYAQLPRRCAVRLTRSGSMSSRSPLRGSCSITSSSGKAQDGRDRGT